MHIKASDGQVILVGGSEDDQPYAAHDISIYANGGQVPLVIFTAVGDQLNMCCRLSDPERIVSNVGGILIGEVNPAPDPTDTPTTTKSSTVQAPASPSGFSVAAPPEQATSVAAPAGASPSSEPGAASPDSGAEPHETILEIDEAGKVSEVDAPTAPVDALFKPYGDPENVGWAGWYEDPEERTIGWRRLDGTFLPCTPGQAVEVTTIGDRAVSLPPGQTAQPATVTESHPAEPALDAQA